MRFAAFLSRLARNLNGAKRLARHCRLDRQSHTLRPSDISQRGHTDSHGRRKDLTQGDKAGVQCAARSKYVVDDEYVAWSGVECPDGCAVGAECSLDVGLFLIDSESGLSAGVSCAAEQVGPERHAELCCNGSGNDLCLIVAAFPFPTPVQGDGYDDIHVSEQSTRDYSAAQHCSEISAGCNVPFVLDVVENLSVSGIVFKKEQGAGPCIGFAGVVTRLAYQCVESVCHRIM